MGDQKATTEARSHGAKNRGTISVSETPSAMAVQRDCGDVATAMRGNSRAMDRELSVGQDGLLARARTGNLGDPRPNSILSVVSRLVQRRFAGRLAISRFWLLAQEFSVRLCPHLVPHVPHDFAARAMVMAKTG